MEPQRVAWRLRASPLAPARAGCEHHSYAGPHPASAAARRGIIHVRSRSQAFGAAPRQTENQDLRRRRRCGGNSLDRVSSACEGLHDQSDAHAQGGHIGLQVICPGRAPRRERSTCLVRGSRRRVRGDGGTGARDCLLGFERQHQDPRDEHAGRELRTARATAVGAGSGVQRHCDLHARAGERDRRGAVRDHPRHPLRVCRAHCGHGHRSTAVDAPGGRSREVEAEGGGALGEPAGTSQHLPGR